MQGLPPSEWPQEYKYAFVRNALNDGSLLAREAEELGLEMRKSQIENAGNGVFTTRAFKCGDHIACFWGHIVYGELSLRDGENDRTLYGGIEFGVTYEKWRNYAWDLSRLQGDSSIRIAPSSQCVAGYINDCRILRGAVMTSERHEGLDHNVACLELESTVARTIDPEILTFEALRDIEVGEELFVDYGRDYNVYNPRNETNSVN